MLIGLFLWIWALHFSTSVVAASREYQIKAAFVHKFTLFADYPVGRSDNADRNFLICIYGSNPFNGAFASVEGTKVKGRTLQVKRLSAYIAQKDLLDCQVVYLSKDNDEQTVKKVLHWLRYKPILTVGEHSEFLQLGGMIRVFSKHNKVVFSVNTSATKKVGIYFRSQMLRVAEQVIDRKSSP